MRHHVATFYEFIPLADPTMLRTKLREFCASLELRGTILLAPEGINATISGSRQAVSALVEALRSGAIVRPAFQRMELKFSSAELQPFQHLKIRVKQEIVAFGEKRADPRVAAGTYINPEDWNTVLADHTILLIDTRNDFEVAIGTFPGAINPRTMRFGDFAAFARNRLDPGKHRSIAMFCTGGIRCEKASAFLLAEGFPEVLHLKGGILNYLESVPARDSRWQGECFVFDERVTLSHADFEP